MARTVRDDTTALPQPVPALSRWLGALDALAPYLIITATIAVGRHAFVSSLPGTVAAVLAVTILAIGTAIGFFRDMSDAHLAWPVALALAVVVTPLLTLHVRLENIALGEPAAIQILPLAFTWVALLAVTCLIVGIIYTIAATQPGWAGILVSPLAVMLGTIPLLSLNPSRSDVLTALLSIFALTEIASGVAWLIPEDKRWYIIPVLLLLAAAVIGHEYVGTPHHLPGRLLLIVDAALAVLASTAALAAPILCRWLARIGGGYKKGRPIAVAPRNPDTLIRRHDTANGPSRVGRGNPARSCVRSPWQSAVYGACIAPIVRAEGPVP